jgi:hypothetical protein
MEEFDECEVSGVACVGFGDEREMEDREGD